MLSVFFALNTENLFFLRELHTILTRVQRTIALNNKKLQGNVLKACQKAVKQKMAKEAGITHFQASMGLIKTQVI